MKRVLVLALILTGCATTEQTFTKESQAWCEANGGECLITTEQKLKELFIRGFLTGRQQGKDGV